MTNQENPEQIPSAPFDPSVFIAHRVASALAHEARSRMIQAECISHTGERGRARETVLLEYLRQIIPAGFGLGTGFIIDMHGRQSRQQDVVIYRLDYHPVFRVGGINFYPIEAVAATIEVKSTLNGATLDDALANIGSVKQLDRTASDTNYVVFGGAGGQRGPLVDPEQHTHQVLSLVVSVTSGAQPSTLVNHLQAHLSRHPRRCWPNFIVIADTCTIGYNSSIRIDPMTATGLRLQGAEDDGGADPLVSVAHDLLSFLRVAPLIDFKPHNYIWGCPKVDHVEFSFVPPPVYDREQVPASFALNASLLPPPAQGGEI